jgi:D-3-phosphoglycerate dehydrogenase / 2-oxoglutarate reductase
MKILIASKIDSDAIEKLKENHEVSCAFGADKETLKSAIQGCDVLIFRSGVDISAEVMASAPTLKMLIRGGSGTDNVDMEYVNRQGLNLVRVPGPGAKSVAELTFALMLALARRVVEADRLTKQGHWAKSELAGYLLTGKTLGVLGAGNIGGLVAHMGAAWGMKALACVEHPSSERKESFEKAGIELTTRERIMSEADFISVHVPLKPDTRNFVDTAQIALMKKNAYLVNIARGGVVNEAALHAALAEGRIGGAALDVHQAEGEGKVSPLAEFKNVILTPHIGASTVDSQKEIGKIILETMDAFMLEQVPVPAVQADVSNA